VIDGIRARKSWFVIISLLVLSACTAPLQKADVTPEAALQPSSDRFWRHIDNAGESDWFHLLNSHVDALDWRLRMIDSAHHAIDMETFLWKGDRGGAQVLTHLLAAADRGVHVRILLDDSFTPHQGLTLLSIDSHPNIELRVYNPYGNRSGGMVGRTLFNLGDFQRVNHRLHNKTLLVDGWAANVGGRNLAEEYFGLHDDYNFRDLEVVAMGDSVAAVSEHFADFWNSGWSFPAADVVAVDPGEADLESLRDTLDALVGPAQVASEAALEDVWQRAAARAVSGTAQFVADSPAHQDPALAQDQPTRLAEYLVASIDAARFEVTLVTAYLVPTEELAAVIRRCLDRGVRVRILTNSMRSNNHLAAHAAYSRYVHALVASGVELYELRSDAADRNLYMESPVSDKELGLHAKFMLLDEDRVFIGSSNLDPRSLKLNTEVGLMVHSEELNHRLRDSIRVDFLPRNAWSVQLDEEGHLAWVGEGERRSHPPADSPFQQLEDWFIGLLPIDSQM
jgi:cardiolipin synthase C